MVPRRQFFIKLSVALGIPFIPYLRIKEKTSFKTMTVLKVPMDPKRFSGVEDLLTDSSNLNYWKRFRAVKSKFIRQGRLFQIQKMQGRDIVLFTAYKTKEDNLSFINRIGGLKALSKELSLLNIRFMNKIIG